MRYDLICKTHTVMVRDSIMGNHGNSRDFLVRSLGRGSECWQIHVQGLVGVNSININLWARWRSGACNQMNQLILFGVIWRHEY